eukprot:scaffold230_cov353-Prasinococcus_capsulatus_cf.AAC.4
MVRCRLSFAGGRVAEHGEQELAHGLWHEAVTEGGECACACADQPIMCLLLCCQPLACSASQVLIRRVEPTAPSAAQLKPGMVILSFDGINIASDGTVPFRHGERISFSYLVSRKYTRDTVTVDVLYEGKRQTLEVVLGGFNLLIPVHLKGASPSYYIVAGLVFTPVTVPYLRSEYGKEYEYESPVKLLEKMLHAQAKAKDEQIIVISQVLAADVNIGYEDTHNTQVLAFNGKPITNLKQLALLVENSKEEFFKFELEHNQVVVLSGKEARAATGEVLKVHGIPASMSKDIREYLQSGKTGKAKSSKLLSKSWAARETGLQAGVTAASASQSPPSRRAASPSARRGLLTHPPAVCCGGGGGAHVLYTWQCRPGAEAARFGSRQNAAPVSVRTNQTKT